MPVKIDKPSIIEAAGNKPKIIKEFFGRVNSQTEEVSIAKMESPAGWVEPGQRPEFDEYTVVLKGELNVKSEDGSVITVNAGEAIHTKKENGFNTAHRIKRLNTLQSAVLLLLPTKFTEMNKNL